MLTLKRAREIAPGDRIPQGIVTLVESYGAANLVDIHTSSGDVLMLTGGASLIVETLQAPPILALPESRPDSPPPPPSTLIRYVYLRPNPPQWPEWILPIIVLSMSCLVLVAGIIAIASKGV